jgi:[acyl-carrier-protein] S-malonyltransferase
MASAIVAAGGMGFKKIIPLNVAGAYHSRLMKPAAEKFEQFIAPIGFKAPRFAVFTNTTGTQVKTPGEIKAALVKQITSPVLWEYCFRGMAGLGVEQFYECGMGGVLTGLAKRIDADAKVMGVSQMGELLMAAAKQSA